MGWSARLLNNGSNSQDAADIVQKCTVERHIPQPWLRYALASREQNLEGGEGDAHEARPKNRGYSDCAKRWQRSDQGRAVRAWGLVAGHRAGTGTDRKASPALSDRREAKTDAGHEGTWLCGCGAAAWERRARPAPRGRRRWVIRTKLGRLQ